MKKTPLKEKIAYVLVRIGMPLLAWLPLRALYPLGRLVGILCYGIMRRDRERATLNLRLAFEDRLSPRRLRLITKGIFMHLGMMAVECLKLFSNPKGITWDSIEIEHREYLPNTLAKGRGMILMCAHFGNWEFFAAKYYHDGFTGLVISRRLHSPQFQELVKQWRERTGILEHNSDEYPKAILSCLRKNQCLGVLNDQDISKAAGVFVNFFGIPAHTPRFVSDLSFKTGAAMVPSLIVRRKNKTHVIKNFPPIEPREGETKDAYTLRSQQEYATRLEKLIRHHPTHWVWFHRRWRTRPHDIA